MNQVKDVQLIRAQQQLEDMKWDMKERLFGKSLHPFCVRFRNGYLLKLKIQQIFALKRK